MTDIVISNQVDYKKYNYVTPNYELSKLTQQTGGATVTATTSGGQESIFELPAKVINLAQSGIKFTVTIPDLNTKYNWVQANVLQWWQQIQLYTRGGLMLMDLINAHNYTNLVYPYETKLIELETNDQFIYGAIAADAIGYGQGFRTASNETNYYPTEAAAKVDGPNEILYTLQGAVGDGAGSGIMLADFFIPFSMFKGTILSLDKDLYFNGEVVLLRFVWGPSTKMFWTGASGTDPTSTPVAAAASVAISNLYTYISLEQNQLIQQDVMAKCNSAEGLGVLIPYVYNNKINLTGNSQTITLRYNRAHGVRLKKIYHGVYNNTESANTMYSHPNLDGVVISNFYTMLDNVRRSQFNIDCTAGEDYLVLKNKLKGSCIISYTVFADNWAIVEDYTNAKPRDELPMKPDLENLVVGESLDTERKIDIYLTTAGGQYNHYSFAITEKLLTVSASGIALT